MAHFGRCYDTAIGRSVVCCGAPANSVRRSVSVTGRRRMHPRPLALTRPEHQRIVRRADRDDNQFLMLSGRPNEAPRSTARRFVTAADERCLPDDWMDSSPVQSPCQPRKGGEIERSVPLCDDLWFTRTGLKQSCEGRFNGQVVRDLGIRLTSATKCQILCNVHCACHGRIQ